MRLSGVLFLFLLAPLLMAKTPGPAKSDLESAFVLKPPAAQTARPRIDRLTWTFLAADGGARMLDAYSTTRMLKNNCSSGQKMVGVSTCNYEQNLPAFIANSTGSIYAFDGAMWLSELGATRFLIRHHHRRIARFISILDFASTTSFAVNNLTLSVGESADATAVASQSHFRIQKSMKP
ncbi:hypothetical protein P8935_06995 [Telmatobacter sp. DSM 110680]|uniref:Uncharacterized protein n=1 Tax=Telmatobacter sp. DSM 110680 TaxID=3036704 RepID=A0AAU7DLN1_9BACT